MFAAMGISGFGKATVKKQLDPSRFDNNKREEVGSSFTFILIKCLTLRKGALTNTETCCA